MNEARVRLIFNASLGTRQRLAALAGARAFGRFGVMCDCTDAANRKELRQVKAGERIGSIVRAEKPVVRTEDLLYESAWTFMFYSKTIYGLGITPNLLLDGDAVGLIQDEGAAGRTPYTLGVGLIGTGGLLSIERMLYTGGGLGERAIGAAVRHELGHVLGVKDHCTDEKCIMQENRNHGGEGSGYADFIERFVKPGLDFCRDCQARIGRFVDRAMFGH